MSNFCNIFPQVSDNQGKLTDSQLFTELLAYANNDRNKAKNLYAATKTDEFKSWFGDWQSARKDWINHKYNNLNDALLAYNVQGIIDAKGEPSFTNNVFTKKDGTTMLAKENTIIRRNTINDYVNNNRDNPAEIKLLKIHKESVNTLSRLKQKVKSLKVDKQKLVKKLHDENRYNQNDPDLIKFEKEIEATVDESKLYSDRLANLESGSLTEKKDDYDVLANMILDRIENTPGYNLKSPEGIKSLSDNYNILKMLSNINSMDTTETVLPLITSDRAIVLKDQILNNIQEYISSLTPFVNLSGTDSDQLTLDMIEKSEKDINSLEFIFNGFGDYPRLEAQLIHSRVLKGKATARLNTIKKVGELFANMNELKEWAKTNIKGSGLYTSDAAKLKQAYKYLVSETNTGRLDLVKPFTNSYYEDLNTAFKDRYSGDKTLEAKGKLWLKDNYHKIVGEDNVSSKYKNSRYSFIQNTPPLKKFYDYFQKEVAEGYELLPPWIENNNKEKVPSLVADKAFSFIKIIQNMKDQTSIRPLWEAVKVLLFGNGSIRMYDENGNIDRVKHEELSGDDIRLRYMNEINAEDKSTDLGKVLKEWISFTQEYHEMSNALPEVRLIQSVAGAKQYQKGDKLIDGTSSTMYKAINMYVGSKVLNNESPKFGKLGFLGGKVYNELGDTIGEQEYYLSDFVKSLISYTRLLNLGLNPFSALNNIIVGYSNDLLEAAGNEYFTRSDIVWATKVYFGQRLNEESKYNKLIEFIQPLQEYGEYEDLSKVELPNITSKIRDKFFFMQHYGEDFVQSITMIAYLKNQTIQATDGTKKSLWDLFSVENDKLKFNHSLAGFKFTNNELNKHRETIKKVNRTIHGNYSKDNSSVFEPHVWYQAAMLFKKWMPQAIASRFQGERYDYYSGNTLEGRYRTLFKYLKQPGRVVEYMTNMVGSIIGLQNNVKKYKDLKPNEIANMRKNIMEVTLMLSFILLHKLLSIPPEEKDKKAWKPDWYEDYVSIPYWLGKDSKGQFRNWNSVGGTAYKYMLYQINSGLNDASNFYDPSFYKDIHTKFALEQTVSNLSLVFWSLITEATSDKNKQKTFQSGPNKGKNKAVQRTLNAIPIVKQANRLYNSKDASFNDIIKPGLSR